MSERSSEGGTEEDGETHSQAFREGVYRRNFAAFLADNLLFNIAAGITGSTTVIPDFARHLTSSEIVIGLLGSLFAIGNTLPQLFVARYIVRYARKKWWFVGPNIPVRFAILFFAAIAMAYGEEKPGLVLLAFFVCYCIAAFGDGLVGVPWADLAGTSLDGRRRARMFGLTTAVTGVVMLAVAPVIAVVLGENGPGFPDNYALLFGVSGAIFAISIVPGFFIYELPGGKGRATVTPLGEFMPYLGRVLRADGPFRMFVVTRMFTSLFMMAGPFYIGYATVQLGVASAVAVPTLLAIQTVGSILGALAYTWLGGRNNLLYIRLALAGATLLPLCALLAGTVGPAALYFGFLMAGLATGSNLGSGYLNWIVSYADAEQRPIYVGLSNTLAAVTYFFAPFIGGAIAQQYGYRPLFAVALMMALSALFVAVRYLRDTHTGEAKGLAAATGAAAQ